MSVLVIAMVLTFTALIFVERTRSKAVIIVVGPEPRKLYNHIGVNILRNENSEKVEDSNHRNIMTIIEVMACLLSIVILVQLIYKYFFIKYKKKVHEEIYFDLLFLLFSIKNSVNLIICVVSHKDFRIQKMCLTNRTDEKS